MYFYFKWEIKKINLSATFCNFVLKTYEEEGDNQLTAEGMQSNRYFILFNVHNELMNWVLLSQNNTFDNRDSEKVSNLLEIM